MASKFSRAALIAGLAVGAGGLVAGPASAANHSVNSAATANYYVNNPVVVGVSSVTPESVTVSGAIDTGGNPESILNVGSGLTWDSVAIAGLTAFESQGGVQESATFAPVDGIPISGSSSNVSALIKGDTDVPTATFTPASGSGSTAKAASGGGTPFLISNGGADNYSDVTFEYDPVSDYDATDNVPGPNTQFAQDVQVPTAAGISSVSTTLGAFGQAAQNSTGNTALMPGTKYYYWIVQQAGATSAASNINVAAWTQASTNNTYKCYPNALIAADPTLEAEMAPGATVAPIASTDVTQPADQGPCIYYYGDTPGSLYYQSNMGTFTTPKLGSVNIQANAKVTKTGASLVITDASGFKASGAVKLTAGGKLAGTAKFSLQAHAKTTAKIMLTAAGRAALKKGQSLKVAPVSQTATIASTSAFDQPLSGKSVKL